MATPVGVATPRDLKPCPPSFTEKPREHRERRGAGLARRDEGGIAALFARPAHRGDTGRQRAHVGIVPGGPLGPVDSGGRALPRPAGGGIRIETPQRGRP